MSNQNNHSDELFDELNQKKKKRRRKVLRTVLAVLTVVAVLGATAVSMLRRNVEARFAAAAAEVLSYEAASGSISTLVSGSGTLADVDVETLTVPSGVEIAEVIVEHNTLVSKGDILATVDMATVMTALADIQEEIDALDEQIADAKGDEVSSYIKAGIPGRIKRIFAEKGTDVTACMAEHGALAVISLDGYMALEIETDALERADSVTIHRENGEELMGTVESATQGTAVILVTDNGPRYDEEVTVKDENGTILGEGKLYIHNPLAVTGYAGTVSYVSAAENAKVYASSSLFTLKDTSFSANYDTLLRARGEKEELLLELLSIYRDGAILAPMDGLVNSVLYGKEDTGVQQLYVTETESSDTELLELCPNVRMCITIGVDETDILSLAVGQEAEVTVSSVCEEPLRGVVSDISTEAAATSGVPQYSAEITVEKLDGMLPGMTAEVDVKIEGVENALIIPLDALHQTSNISYVYTTYDPELAQYGGMVGVVTGMQNDKYVEILSGLQAGDTVYYTETKVFHFGFGMGMGSMPHTGGGMPDMSGGGFGGGMPGMGTSRGG